VELETVKTDLLCKRFFESAFLRLVRIEEGARQ
jgi:hypothetical protein